MADAHDRAGGEHLSRGGFLGDALALAFADRSGSTLAVAQGARALLFDTTSGSSESFACLGPLADHASRVRAIRPSFPSFNHLAAAGGRYAVCAALPLTSSGSQQSQLHAGPFRALSLTLQPLDSSPDRLFVGLADNSVEEWLLSSSSSNSFCLRRSSCSERCLLFSLNLCFDHDSNALIAAGGTAHRVLTVWRPFASEEPSPRLDGHGGCAFCVEVCPELGAVASASEDRTIRLWSLDSGEQLLVLYSHCSRAWVCLLLTLPRSNQPVLIESGEDGLLRIWLLFDGMRRAREGFCVRAHGGRGTWAIAAQLNREIIASGGADASVRTWSLLGRVASSNDGSKSNSITAYAADGTQTRAIDASLFNDDAPSLHELRKATGPVRPRDFALCPVSGRLFIANQQGEVCEANKGAVLSNDDGLGNVACIDLQRSSPACCCQCIKAPNDCDDDVKEMCASAASDATHHRLCICSVENCDTNASQADLESGTGNDHSLNHRTCNKCVLPRMLIACQDGVATIAQPRRRSEEENAETRWQVCTQMRSDITHQRLKGAMWLSDDASALGLSFVILSKDGEASLRSELDGRDVRLQLGMKASVMAADVDAQRRVALAATRGGDITLFALPGDGDLQRTIELHPHCTIKRAHGTSKLEFLRLLHSSDGGCIAESGGRDGCLALYTLTETAGKTAALELSQYSRERVSGLTTVRASLRSADVSNALVGICGFNRKEASIVEPRSGKPFLQTTSNGVNAPAIFRRLSNGGSLPVLSLVCVCGPEIHHMHQSRAHSALQESTMLTDRFHGYTIHTVALRRRSSTAVDAFTGAEDGSVCETRLHEFTSRAQPLGQIAEHGVGAKVCSLHVIELRDEWHDGIRHHLLLSGGSRGVLMCWLLPESGSKQPTVLASRRPKISKAKSDEKHNQLMHKAGQQRNISASGIELSGCLGKALLALGSSCGAIFVYYLRHGKTERLGHEACSRNDDDGVLNGCIECLQTLRFHQCPVLCCDVCNFGSRVVIVSGATSGDVTLWIAGAESTKGDTQLRERYASIDSNDSEGWRLSMRFVLAAHFRDVHLNGVNAIAIERVHLVERSTSSSRWSVVLATGGDDQRVEMRAVEESEEEGAPQVIAVAKRAHGHTSSVKGAKLCFAGEEMRLVTAGLDQRVKLWKPEWSEEALKLLDSVVTEVVDVQSLDVAAGGRNGSVTACVVGRGVQSFTLDGRKA